MKNEIILILSMLFIYGSVIFWFYLFGEKGLFSFLVLATITANIEVLILIEAFKIEQTLGNILFSSTFLITDILGELYGKEKSKKAVYIGILTSVTFILISQSWLLYTPKYNDEIFSSIVTLFSSTPRIMFASLGVYAISQIFDVFIYHKCWDITKKLSGNNKKYLWIRNNCSTLISQLLNAFLFTLIAFYGVYDNQTIVSIFTSSYLIFIIASLFDTPFIYLARIIYNKKLSNKE